MDKFISAPEGSAQPSSQASARALDHLDRLIARVEQMYGMLETHMQNTTNQYTYIEGQITRLSSQIDDMIMEQRQQQEGSESESKQFQPLWPFQSKRVSSLRGSIAQHIIDISLLWWCFSSSLWFQQSTFFFIFIVFITLGYLHCFLLNL